MGQQGRCNWLGLHSLSRFFVAPLDVVKIRFQLQMHPSIQTAQRPDYFYRSIPDAFATIYRKEGIRVRRISLELIIVFIGRVSGKAT